MQIQSIHITTYQEQTWGRVYIQYKVRDDHFFIFKNWIKFEEKVYKGFGSLMDEPAYNWFTENNRHIFTDLQFVLDGGADNLYLTPEKYKILYGTPSVIFKRLLIELKANIAEPVENRRGWFNKMGVNNIVLSDIMISRGNNIFLSQYDTEIKMPALVKLVYLFFLKHPEGIKIVDLTNHTNELLDIYQSISAGNDAEKAQKSIETLVNPIDNSIHEKFSKIKKLLVDSLGEKIAANYLISGNKGEKYKINISPVKIIFE